MGNCISISIPLDCLDGMVSRPLEEKGWCTHKLIKNLRDLETTMEELKCRRDDLSRRFAIEEDRDLQRLSGFQVWLHNVETVEVEVNALLNDRDVELQRLCLCRFCSKSIILSHRYGKIVFLTLMKISKLKGDVFGVIAEQASTSVVEEKPLLRTIVGQEVMLERAWNHLMDDGVGIMGIYGMGGVGKTILFTQIFNKLSHVRGGFDYVIWVVVSKDIQVNRIQDVIAQRVGLGGGILNQKDQQAVRLFNFLKNKRFVLLLDDVWDKVDLAEIGVPLPTRENRCKVTFTTRSQEVCAHMGDENPMEVRCLEETDAFDLFQKKVGERTLGSDPGIPHLARIVAKKCYGLPLALNIIGEVMSCKRTIQEWRHGVTVLSSNAADFSGMEDYIFPILKYSYDNLRGEQEKSCLLYCAVYPEDAKILKDKLIEYWICEDIIDGSEGIERAEDKGYDIIGSLVRASLLIESVDDQDGRTFVIMHDAVREMALWIATTMGTQKDGFIVRASVGLNEIPKVKNWEVVKRMSLMDNKIHHLVGSPKCMELTTLLLQNTWLDNISSEFFSYMPKLVVLDLSDNSFLSELPKEISKLVSLQYLSLRETRIRHLPKGLLELKNLIYFDLEETYALESIAGISSLHHLKVLKLAYSGFPWDINTVKELECMEHVEILTTTIDPGPEQLLNSKKLMSRTRFLGISGFVSSLNRYLESCGISLPESMDKLRCFNIKFCGISEIKMGRLCSFLSLVEVLIEGCECLRELTFLMFAPNLRILYVEGAKDLEDIINKERACEGEISEIEPFQKLEYLQLVSLPKLKNIFWSPLPLSCLKRIDVIKCPILKKLPLSAKSCNQINELVIQYTEKEWINGVRWEDRATKSRFLPSCVYIQSEIDEISHFLP